MIFATLLCSLLLYHAVLARPSFYSYADKPYPPLPRPMTQLSSFSGSGTPYRIMPLAPERSISPGYVTSLMHGLATVYNVISLEGYNPFVQITPPNRLASTHFKNDPLRAAQAYGVRWIVVHRLVEHPVYGPNPQTHAQERLVPWRSALWSRLKPHASKKLVLPDVTIWELDNVSPLAFAASQPFRALPVKLRQDGVDVTVAPVRKNEKVMVNMLWRPEMQATIDGQILPVESDQWGRIVVLASAPARSAMLQIRYVPPWKQGFMYSAVLAVMAVAATALLTKLHERY